EHLLAREEAFVAHVFEDRRRDQVAVVVDAYPAREHGAALLPAALDRSNDVVELALVDDRTDLDVRVEWVADLPAFDAGEQLLLERVVDGVLHVDAARGRALLSGRPEGAGKRRLDRAVELGVGEDDQRVVAAELELDALPEPRRLVAHG